MNRKKLLFYHQFLKGMCFNTNVRMALWKKDPLSPDEETEVEEKGVEEGRRTGRGRGRKKRRQGVMSQGRC